MSSESKSTPGPWGVIKAGNQISVVPVDGKGKPRNGRETVDICSMSVFIDDAAANAHLISACPDLLAACEEMLTQIGKYDTGLLDAAEWMLAAVAKARGK